MKKSFVLFAMLLNFSTGFASEVETSGPETQVAPVVQPENGMKESEIPLNLEAGKKSTSEAPGAFRIIFTLSILGIVGTGAYFFIRKYKVPQAAQHQTQIKVLQQHYLGPKKSLAIVRVAGESILIGVTDQNISLIKSLALLDEDIPEHSTQEQFDSVLTQVEPKEQILKNKSAALEASEEIADRIQIKTKTPSFESDEEFAISGIKDIVSKRLKGMRSFQ